MPNSNVALFDLAFPGSQPVRLATGLSAFRQGADVLARVGIPSRNASPRSARRDCVEL